MDLERDAQLRILLVEDNAGDARLVREMLSEAEGPKATIHHVESLVAALDELARVDAVFDVALVDLSLPDSQGFETFTTIQTHAPSLPIVVLTGLDSEALALQAVRKGAQDYLVKGKLDTPSLVRALQYAVVRRAGTSDQATPGSTVIAVLSSKGGVGATTVACHFALEIKAQTDEKVLLLDPDVSSAGAGFLMRADFPYSTLDVITNLHRLDADYWKRVVYSSSAGVDLLQSPGAIRYGDQLSSERVRHVLRFARSLYRWIVVDLGRMTATSISFLPEVKDILLVTTHELPALYEVKRIIRNLLDLGFESDRIHLVVNRASKDIGPVEDLVRVLGHPVRATLSDCTKELTEALLDGRPLKSDLPLRKQIAPLASRLIGKPEQVAPHAQRGLRLFRFARS